MPFPNPDTQFRPGQSGNPNGRPTTKYLTKMLHEALEADDGKQAAAVIRALVRGARKGSIAHIREVLDRVEGKVAIVLREEESRDTEDIPDEDERFVGERGRPAEPGDQASDV